MSRMIISPHDRTEGISTSRSSAGLNATADALEQDRQRNMPSGLRGRHHEQTLAHDVMCQIGDCATNPFNGRKSLTIGKIIKCALCGNPIVRRNARHKYCARCRIKAYRAINVRAMERRYAKDRLASVSESISMWTVRQ